MPDLRQAVELLRRQLRLSHLKVDVDFHSIILGSYLPLIILYRHLCECDYEIHQFLVSNNFLLSETEDRRFMESLYRICRDILNMKPALSLAQFFTNSFIEKKIHMATAIIKAFGALKKDLKRRSTGDCSVSALPCSTSAPPGSLSQRSSSPRSLSPMPVSKQPLHWEGVSSTADCVPASERAQTACDASLASNKPSNGGCSVLKQPLSSPPTQPQPRRTLCSSPQLDQPLAHPKGRDLGLGLGAVQVPGKTTFDDEPLESLSSANPPRQGFRNETFSASLKPTYVEDAEYLRGISITLDSISNQLSHLVNRIAGIELRVCAIEQPILESVSQLKNPEKQQVPDQLSFETKAPNNKNNPSLKPPDSVDAPAKKSITFEGNCSPRPVHGKSADTGYPPEFLGPPDNSTNLRVCNAGSPCRRTLSDQPVTCNAPACNRVFSQPITSSGDGVHVGPTWCDLDSDPLQSFPQPAVNHEIGVTRASAENDTAIDVHNTKPAFRQQPKSDSHGVLKYSNGSTTSSDTADVTANSRFDDDLKEVQCSRKRKTNLGNEGNRITRTSPFTNQHRRDSTSEESRHGDNELKHQVDRISNM
uniref:Centrosomal protein of 44 kDa n=1 Tax=Mesocestoides corti TaxID=53468 RepID=A0A5K3EWJ5_MESCO